MPGGWLLRAIGLYAFLTLAAVIALRLDVHPHGYGVIAYTREVARNGAMLERADVYLHDLDHGLALNWTNTPTWHEYSPIWSPDGAALVVTAYSLNSPDNRLCMLSFAAGMRCSPAVGWYERVIWLDAGQIGFQYDDPLTGMSSVVTTTPALDPLARHERGSDGAGAYERLRQRPPQPNANLSPDGRWVAILQADPAGRTRIVLYDQINTAAQPIAVTPDDDGDYFFAVWWPG